MLTLVCLLLALLCVCVYILKKNNATNCTNSKCINSSILWQKFNFRFKLFNRKKNDTENERTSIKIYNIEDELFNSKLAKKTTVNNDKIYNTDECIEIKNWRYHLTNDHFWGVVLLEAYNLHNQFNNLVNISYCSCSKNKN